MQLPALLRKAAQPLCPLPPPSSQDKWPNMLRAPQVRGSHSAAGMLLALGSTAWDTSQGIPAPGPGPAQQETHFHHCGGCTSAFPAFLLSPCKAELKAALWQPGSCLTLGTRKAFSLSLPSVSTVKIFSTKSLSFWQIWLKLAKFKCYWGRRRQTHTALTLKFRLRCVL